MKNLEHLNRYVEKSMKKIFLSFIIVKALINIMLENDVEIFTMLM